MTGYLFETCGEASFTRSGWLAHIRAVSRGQANVKIVLWCGIHWILYLLAW